MIKKVCESYYFDQQITFIPTAGIEITLIPTTYTWTFSCEQLSHIYVFAMHSSLPCIRSVCVSLHVQLFFPVNDCPISMFLSCIRPCHAFGLVMHSFYCVAPHKYGYCNVVYSMFDCDMEYCRKAWYLHFPVHLPVHLRALEHELGPF